MILPLPDWANYLAALLALILGSARLTRLFVHDSYPPVAWLRSKWDLLTERSGWNDLLHCHFCLAPWITFGVAGWFALGLIVPWIAWTWWIIVGLLGASYLASMLVERDDRE
jgi:hypothetical protein